LLRAIHRWRLSTLSFEKMIFFYQKLEIRLSDIQNENLLHESWEIDTSSMLDEFLKHFDIEDK